MMNDNEQENEKRETLADIVAEMRRREKSHYYPKVARNIMHQYSDRIEEAWRREKDELVYAYDPTKAAKGRLPDGSAYALEAMREPVTERHAVGNAAAMREALVLCSRIIGENGIRGNVFFDDIQEAHRAITAALALPLRNCDIGTAEEQEERFHEFCNNHWGSNDRSGNNCGMCSLSPINCRLEWAQMPYEAEEGGAK